MPHPDSLVSVEREEETGVSPQTAFDNVVVVAPMDEEPDAGFNSTLWYMDASSVEDDFGEDTDIYEGASEALSESDEIMAMALETESHSETYSGDGEVENTPITGTSDIDISVGGVDVDVVPVIASPPDPEDAEWRIDDPDGDYVVINTDTGEFALSVDGELVDDDTYGDGTLGDGTIGGDDAETNDDDEYEVEIEYTTINWSDALERLESSSANILNLAGHRWGYESIGDLDELVPWLDSNDIILPIAYPNAQEFDSAEDALDLAIDVGSYAPSRSVFAISNETSGMLASRTAGLIGANDPGFNIFMEELGGFSVPRGSRLERLIGAPESGMTFEGGDDGAGPSNVLVNDGGTTVFSNSMTTSGTDSDYRYLDVTRRVAWAEDRARRSVADLLQNRHVTFQDDHLIEEAITRELGVEVGGSDAMFRELDVDVPEREDLPDSAVGNRIWEGIELELALTGYVHRAEMVLRTTL